MAVAPELVVGVDVGTSRVAVVVAEARESGLAVVGAGSAPCDGVRGGIIVNLDTTTQAIETAVREAEAAAEVEIHSVIAGIGGDHIRGLNSHGVVAVAASEVDDEDVARVIETARTIAFPPDVDILHVLPQEYIVDGVGGIRSPVGMSAVRLEAHVHVITTASLHARNVLRCCERVGLHVADLVLAPLAATEAVLDPEEKEAGVAVLDIGAGTTDVIVWVEGAVRHSAVLPLGGNHITSDVAAGLRTPFREAEALKCEHGAVPGEADSFSSSAVEVATAGPRGARLVSRDKLAHIIEARTEEILGLARDRVARGGLLEDLGCGVVVTGGSALLPGIVSLAERVFQCPVRAGAPIGIVDESPGAPGVSRIDPRYSAAVGLVLYGLRPLDPTFGPGGRDGAPGAGSVGSMMAWLRRLISRVGRDGAS